MSLNHSLDPKQKTNFDYEKWPRDFDFREAYAEQQELLDAASQHSTTSPQKGGSSDER